MGQDDRPHEVGIEPRRLERQVDGEAVEQGVHPFDLDLMITIGMEPTERLQCIEGVAAQFPDAVVDLFPKLTAPSRVASQPQPGREPDRADSSLLPSAVESGNRDESAAATAGDDVNQVGAVVDLPRGHHRRQRAASRRRRRRSARRAVVVALAVSATLFIVITAADRGPRAT